MAHNMNKRGVKFGIVLSLLVISLLLVWTIFAETPEEEKARLKQELSDLETQLSQIDNGTWVNFYWFHERINVRGVSE